MTDLTGDRLKVEVGFDDFSSRSKHRGYVIVAGTDRGRIDFLAVNDFVDGVWKWVGTERRGIGADGWGPTDWGR